VSTALVWKGTTNDVNTEKKIIMVIFEKNLPFMFKPKKACLSCANENFSMDIGLIALN
jgi:hypothetical protein